MDLHHLMGGLSEQGDLSRRAAERHQLQVAVAELRSRRPPRLRRVRHRLAVALVAAARLVDATDAAAPAPRG